MKRSYGFELKGAHQQHSVGLYAIGHEIQTESNYRWDGNKRPDDHCFVFQYTLNGRGAIKIADETYELEKNQAFWIEVPSDHCYYLPDDSDEWEFIYLTLFGDVVSQLYQQLTKHHGHILTYSDQSPIIQLIYNMINQVELNQLTNSYQASAHSYQFLMALAEGSSKENDRIKQIPTSIQTVMTYINEHYDQDLGLQDFVQQSGLSKYYFTRQFKKFVGMTAIHYLTKIRIKKAIRLLLNESASINEIARKVGYKDGNYFSKVFKKHVGTSPKSYRQARSSIQVDHWFTD